MARQQEFQDSDIYASYKVPLSNLFGQTAVGSTAPPVPSADITLLPPIPSDALFPDNISPLLHDDTEPPHEQYPAAAEIRIVTSGHDNNELGTATGWPGAIELRSLNLVCYRPANGVKVHQITVARPTAQSPVSLTTSASTGAASSSGTAPEHDFEGELAKYPPDKKPITTDKELLRTIRDCYKEKLCQPWRRLFSLQSVRTLRLRSYVEGESTRPAVVESNPIMTQELMYFVHHPDVVEGQFARERAWIDWVFALRAELPDGRVHRHMLEYVEGWSPLRITVAASVPLVGSVVIGVVWASLTGRVEAAFAVASFVLTLGSAILALLAVISTVASGS